MSSFVHRHAAHLARDLRLPTMTLHERILGAMDDARHRHDDASLRILFSGEMIDRTAQQVHRLRAGDVLFHPPRTDHATAVPLGCHLLLVHFERRFTGTISRIYESTPVTTRATSNALGGVPAKIERELRLPDRWSPTMLEALILELLAVAARLVRRPPDPFPKWLETAVAYMHEHYAKKLTPASVARVAGVSDRVFHAGFQQHRLGSFPAYLRNIRVSAAAALLTGDNDLATIAGSCGFYDGAHLTHVFKAVKGLTPSDFRRAARASHRAKPVLADAPWRR